FARALVVSSSVVALSVLDGCSCGPDPGTASSTITFPVDGAVVAGAPLVITGTASAQRSPLTQVEVSLDNGTTWVVATGTDPWSYSLSGAADGSLKVLSRASTQGGGVE